MYVSEPQARRNLPVAFLIFAAVLGGLLWLHGNRLILISDEGIILTGANRMLHGEILYRDFFGYLAPGSYWLQLAAFDLFGVSQWAGRVPVVLGFAAQCALLFWLTARLGGRAAGLAATVLFFAFQAPVAFYLFSQHRMDSAALAFASVTACIEGEVRGRIWYWAAAGVLLGAAAACTPPVGLLAPVTLAWLWIGGTRRRFLKPYVGGLAAALAAMFLALAASGSLVQFVRQMIWLQRNYSGVNIMHYGAIIGGYRAALGTASGMEFVFRLIAILWRLLPALLPPAAFLAWGVSMFRKPAARSFAVKHGIFFLLAATLALVVSAYPRPDIAHLAFIAALPSVLTAVWIARFAPRVPAICLVGILIAWGGFSLALVAGDLKAEVAITTPVGTLYSARDNAAPLGSLLREVQPHDSLYVHPYNPMFYFVSQTKNPTRYSYLNPGMMTREDELSTLADLERSPPRWLLYCPTSRESFLHVFPHGVDLDYRFHLIEAFLSREYIAVEPAIVVEGYRLYQRR